MEKIKVEEDKKWQRRVKWVSTSKQGSQGNPGRHLCSHIEGELQRLVEI